MSTFARCASFFLSHIGLLIYVAVQKPNAHYECFNGGDYDHEMWSGAHKRWCCYKYKEDSCTCRIRRLMNDGFSFLL